MKKYLVITVAFIFFTGVAAHAQWTNNLMLNTAVSVLNGSVTPLSATMDNGFTYVSYYWPDSNLNYTLYLQLLDTAGNKMWGANGVAACTKPSGTSVSLYDLKVDHAGNAVLGAQFIDTTSYTDTVFVTKISPAGTPLWGANGIALGAAISPVLCITPQNNVIVAARGGAMIWKITSTGHLAWAQPDTLPAKVENAGLVPTNSEDVIIEYFLAGNNFQYGNLYAMKYDSTGATKWPHAVEVSTQVAAVWDAIHCVADGSNGLLTAFTSYSAINQDGFAQHINATGDTLWTTDGLEVSNDSTVLKFVTGLVYNASQKNTYVIESESDLNQVYYGVKVQKIDSSGIPQFTAKALETEPVDSSTTAGGIALENDGLVYIYTNDSSQIKADKIDFSGNKIWQRFVCTQTSSKLNPALGSYQDHQLVIVWEDDRNNTSGIYAQSFIDTIAKDTTGTAIYNTPGQDFHACIYPNPSCGSTLNLQVILTRPENFAIRIADITGQEVYAMPYDFESGSNTLALPASHLSPGLYFIQMQNESRLTTIKWVCAR